MNFILKMNMNNEMFLENTNQKMLYNNYNINRYQTNINNNNFSYTITSPKAKNRNIQNNMKLYYNISKSPNCYDSKQKYSNNTFNKAGKIYNNNINQKNINNNKQRASIPSSYSQKSNNVVSGNKVMEIQERFD